MVLMRRKINELFWILIFYQRLLSVSLHHQGENAEPVVYITISSLASRSDIYDRQLELNWYNIPDHTTQQDVWIRLFGHEPSHNDTRYLVTVHPGYHTQGYYRTTIRFPNQIFNPQNLSNACLGYWIAYVVDELIVTSSCIRARPKWMYELKHIIGNARLSDLVIPGTHNAGCYAKFHPNNDTLINKYLITQEEDVWSQLVYGIRYLDLRVAYDRPSGTEDRFWITHSVFTTEKSVRDIIMQVKNFLNATNEIVIMDFHRFVNGFSGRRARHKHRLLIQFLESELSDYMIPVSATLHATLNELWTVNRRLLVGYASTERSRSAYLFPAVKHLWADKDRTDTLFRYLNENVCGQTKPQLTSAMAQLTPSTAGTLFDAYGGLRQMAHDVNRHIAKWLREIWWHCANIVSMDFFFGSNIIETAIEINKKKFSG